MQVMNAGPAPYGGKLQVIAETRLPLDVLQVQIDQSGVLAEVAAVDVTGYARSFNYAFRGNDDTVWLYLTGVELFHPNAAAPLHEAVRDFLPTQPDGERALRQITCCRAR